MIDYGDFMGYFEKILAVLSTMAEPPPMYGWYHIMCWVLTFAFAVLFCFLYKKGIIKRVNAVVVSISVIVLVFEIYKMIVVGFYLGEGVEYVFPWRSFPWQFCSMPMYIGLLVGVSRGKFQNALYCFLATYAVFAGTAVMIYPGDVFTEMIGVNIQTMICHGSMLTIGIFLYYTGCVKAELKTLFKAMPVFIGCVVSAIVLNDIVYIWDLSGENSFNMFYISPYEEGYLPVYRVVQAEVQYPGCLLIYLIGFTVAAFIVLGVAMAVNGVAHAVKRAKEKRRARA